MEMHAWNPRTRKVETCGSLGLWQPDSLGSLVNSRPMRDLVFPTSTQKVGGSWGTRPGVLLQPPHAPEQTHAHTHKENKTYVLCNIAEWETWPLRVFQFHSFIYCPCYPQVYISSSTLGLHRFSLFVTLSPDPRLKPADSFLSSGLSSNFSVSDLK